MASQSGLKSVNESLRGFLAVVVVMAAGGGRPRERGTRVIGGGAASSKEEARVVGTSKSYRSEDIDGRKILCSSSGVSHGLTVNSRENGTFSGSGAGALSGLNSGSPRSGDFGGRELVM